MNLPLPPRVVPAICLACALGVGGVAGLAAADVPRLKAKVGSPVVTEFMGGCSLTCAFPWAADVAGGQDRLSMLNDARADTAWTGAKVGDRLTFRFPADLPRDLDGTPFFGVDIANGVANPLADFKKYGRVKELLLSHNGRPAFTIRLSNTWRWQRVTFDDIFLNVGDTLELEIVAVYPGEAGRGAALTEIVLQGAH